MTHPSDKELDDYLRRESTVSEHYRALDADDVPAAVDAAVLAQARAAVAPKKQRAPAWVRWGSPLALAASAVLIVAIVLEVGVQEELRVPAPQLERAAKRADEGVVMQVEPPAQSDAPAASAPSLPEPPVESTEAKAARDIVERPLAAIAPPPEPELTFAQGTPAPAATIATAPMPAPAPMQAPRLERQREAADASAGIAAEQRRLEPIIVTGNRLSDATRESARVEEVAVTAQYRAGNASNDRTRPAFGPRAPGAPRPARAGSNVSDEADVAARAGYASPERWLDAIRKLRADGKNAEADDQWRAFRREYPNFEVRAGDRALPEPQR